VFAHLQPDQDRGDGHHRQVVDRQLLVARRHAAVLLEPIDASLNLVALAVELAVEVPLSWLVRLGRDNGLDAPAPRRLARFATAIALVADDLVGAQARASLADALDRALIEEDLKLAQFVSLARSCPVLAAHPPHVGGGRQPHAGARG
jgi:hypothetical protein